MLLDHASTERHGGDRNFGAKRMIGEADRTIERRRQLRNASEIGLLDRRRITADAMQERKIAAAAGAESLDRLADLLGVAIPVDMMVGLPVPATRRINGRSIISNEAIL